ncbi:MBL fold metallo-hydrolase [Cupriavidus gilardii]|uniref:MBL fold metallo-hydrolase n=1 Tax=Cupriavidus gilardii TaxID=82541 RepID=UPI00352C4185
MVDVFALEAFNAAHGDALLLHYGRRQQPRLVLIDGGPGGVYQSTIRPRLDQLADERRVRPLQIAHIIVTHTDDDHIAGILELLQDRDDPPAECRHYWLNTFDEPRTGTLRTPAQIIGVSHLNEQSPADARLLRSVPQGKHLRDLIRERGFGINGGAAQLVAGPGGTRLELDPNLTVTLVGPTSEQLRRLEKEWRAASESRPLQRAYLDSSIFNLSSLVMVMEASDSSGRVRRMLLCGDARGDHILDGLRNAGYLDSEGRVHFDLLKVAHHGSDRNHTAGFFQQVTADHYVISADGRYGNPSAAVLVWIDETAATDYTIWLTTTRSRALEGIATALEAVPSLCDHLRFRNGEELSVSVELAMERRLILDAVRVGR